MLGYKQFEARGVDNIQHKQFEYELKSHLSVSIL